MSLDLEGPTHGNGAVYSDLLLQLEENPTPETLQRLHLKIDQLEEKLYDQARLAHCKELEIYNKYDEKRGQITFKYLQIKAELAKFKALYKEKENLWQRDSSNLLKVVKCLFNTLSQNEEKTKEFLRDIEGELGKEIWQKGIDISNVNVYDSKAKPKRSSSQDGRQTGNDVNYIDIEVPKNGIFQTPKQSSGLGFSRELSPEPFNACKNLFPQIFVTPTLEVQSDYNRENTEIISPSVILNGAPDLNTPQPFSKAPTSSILSVQRKIRDYITELTEHSASQRLKMDREINDILRRVTTFNENLNSENHNKVPVGFLNEKIQNNFLKPPRSSNNKNTLFTPFNKNKSHRLPSYSISTNLINELEAQAPPSILGNFSTEQKYQKESFRTVKKFQDTDHQNTQNDVIRKLDELQNSLALSEKEALLFMMMDNIENNRSRIDVNLDDLLKIPNNKSNSKVSGNSMSSFYHDGSSAIKDAADQLNGSVSIEDPSPRFPIEKSPELNQFTIFTPIAKKKEGMNRPSSPHLAAEIDMYLQNVDLGSFVCHNEEESRHEGVNTPDLNDALSRDGISPILARQKKICQEIPQNYNFPTSVEKEYGRRLGGMLDFDDEHLDHIDNFESQYIKEEESASTNDYGRLPTAEGTESGGKGRKRADSQQEQSGSESHEKTKEFNFQTFSAKKVR